MCETEGEKGSEMETEGERWRQWGRYGDSGGEMETERERWRQWGRDGERSRERASNDATEPKIGTCESTTRDCESGLVTVSAQERVGGGYSQAQEAQGKQAGDKITVKTRGRTYQMPELDDVVPVARVPPAVR